MNARASLLQEAESLVNGDRNAQYGDPKADFQRTASYWNIHLNGVLERKLAQDPQLFSDPVRQIKHILATLFDPHDVAILVDLVKTSRLAWSPQKRDNWADKAGYAACGWDCAEPETTEADEPMHVHPVSPGVYAPAYQVTNVYRHPGDEVQFTYTNEFRQ